MPVLGIEPSVYAMTRILQTPCYTNSTPAGSVGLDLNQRPSAYETDEHSELLYPAVAQLGFEPKSRAYEARVEPNSTTARYVYSPCDLS